MQYNEERLTVMQINEGDFHPDQRYQCNYDLTPYKTIITYGWTRKDAKSRMIAKFLDK